MSLNQIKYHLNKIDEITKSLDLGDIFSYSKVKEVLIASELGHSVPKNYSGADGITPDGVEVEYKSTIGKRIQATYNGISVLPTWEEQKEYLINEKIGKYPLHYYARFEGTTIVEMWELTGQDVLDLVLPRLEKSYKSVQSKKDPRLGITLSQKWIKLKGKKII